MNRKWINFVLILLIVNNITAFAQDADFQSAVDYKVNKMKTELKMTDDQVIAVKPIIKNYLIKRQAILQDVAGQGIVDHVSVKSTLKALKDDEYQKLGKILSEDQLKKLINKDILMASLNSDSIESSDNDLPTLGANGANFKF